MTRKSSTPLVTIILAFLLWGSAAHAQLSCPANPPLRSEKGSYSDPNSALTGPEFDEWMSNVREACTWGATVNPWAALATQSDLPIVGTSNECHVITDTGDRCCWATDTAAWACGAASGGATTADLVSITDAGGHYSATDVEGALQEVGVAVDTIAANGLYWLPPDTTGGGSSIAPANSVRLQSSTHHLQWNGGPNFHPWADIPPGLHASDHWYRGADELDVAALADSCAIDEAPLSTGDGAIACAAVSLPGHTHVLADVTDAGTAASHPASDFTTASVVPSTAPSAGQVLVGNAGGTAYVPRSISGDASLASTGALTVSHATAADSATTATSASTATALAANGSNCTAGSYPLGVDAQGNAESCTTVSSGALPAGTGSELQYRSSGSAFGAVTSSSVSGADVTLGGKLTLPSGGQLRFGTSANDAMWKGAGAAAIMSCRKGDDSDYCIVNAERFRAWASSASAPDVVMLGGTGLQLGSTRQVVWSGSSDATQAATAGLKQAAAKVVAVTDGGSGGGGLRLIPIASPPVTCGSASTEGVIYSDDSHALCWCDGTSWAKLAGAGTCS